MPHHPTWLESVPDILNELKSEKAPSILDRQAIEHLFGVRRRQAIHLLHRFSGYQLGRTFVVPRDAVIEFLQKIMTTGSLESMEARKKSIAGFLGEARQGLRLPTIPLPATKLSEITFAGLPPGIRLQPGQLTIQFHGATDLLEKLFSLSQALANDFEALEFCLSGVPRGN